MQRGLENLFDCKVRKPFEENYVVLGTFKNVYYDVTTLLIYIGYNVAVFFFFTILSVECSSEILEIKF